MVRDRIKELRRVRAGDLAPNPQNWRQHPEAQRKALEAVLDGIGYADALLARELEDGSLQLIDGHLRAERDPDQVVPVLVVDLDETEARALLAVFDPITEMARTDAALLGELVADLETGSAALDELIDQVAKNHNAIEPDQEPAAVTVPDCYQVLAEVGSEAEQKELYDQLKSRGIKCRVLTL